MSSSFEKLMGELVKVLANARDFQFDNMTADAHYAFKEAKAIIDEMEELTK